MSTPALAADFVVGYIASRKNGKGTRSALAEAAGAVEGRLGSEQLQEIAELPPQAGRSSDAIPQALLRLSVEWGALSLRVLSVAFASTSPAVPTDFLLTCAQIDARAPDPYRRVGADVVAGFLNATEIGMSPQTALRETAGHCVGLGQEQLIAAASMAPSGGIDLGEPFMCLAQEWRSHSLATLAKALRHESIGSSMRSYLLACAVSDGTTNS